MYFTYFKQKDMKISKSGLLNLSLVFTVLGLWLVAVSMAQRQLYVDLNNASQYMEKIQFISSWSTDSAFLEQINGSNGSVKIQTNNFILSKTWSDENVISGGYYSSILWWVKNKIEWKGKNVSANVIIGWSENLIRGKYNVILWWKWNNIENWEYSVIVWWKNNVLSWNYSAVLWSDNILEGSRSTVVWKNWDVKGNYSTALWKNSKVEANNSFLWTDGSATEALTEDNVFVVMAKSGMIINANQAHNFAKLTIWWPLILSSKITDENVQCGAWEGWWILKVKDAGSQKCLCSCDGSWRNSMLGKGRCISVCDSSIKPECGTEVRRICDSGNNKVLFSWSCDKWIPAKWTWAYFMDKNDKVHRSCQTDDGGTIWCSGDVVNATEPLEWCESYTCQWTPPDGAILITGSNKNLTHYVNNTLYENEETAGENKCAWICNKYILNYYTGGRCEHAYSDCNLPSYDCFYPYVKTETLTTDHEQIWTCQFLDIDSSECRYCETWYHYNENGKCVKSTCNHCAHSWFPYCFPINFSPSCIE